MKPFQRAERVSMQIQRELSGLLRKGINDPRLEGAVITGVKTAKDLKSARIYFCAPGEEAAREQVMAGFQTARPFIKRELARRLGLRYMPEIHFYYDESLDYGAHIEDILRSLHAGNGPDNPTTDK
jgi:ribosome-binding factor A